MYGGYNSAGARVFLSLQECHLALQPTARFLGFIVDTLAQAFWIPEDKVQAFADRVAG